MKKLAILIFCSLFVAGLNSFGQTDDGGVSIGKGNQPANPKSILELVSQTKGLLIPRMTTGQRTAIFTAADQTAVGLMVYDTNLNSFFYWLGSEWKDMGSSVNASGVLTVSTAPPTNVTGNEVYFDTDTNLFYKYDNGTKTWKELDFGGSSAGSGIAFPSTDTAKPGSVFYHLVKQQFYAFDGVDWIPLSTNGSTPTGTSLPLTAKPGDVFFVSNTTEKKLYLFDGSQWIPVGSSTIADGSVTENKLQAAGAVALTGGVNGQLLTSAGNNQFKWTNRGSVPGGATNPTGAAAGDVYYNTTDKNLYYYDGSSWILVSGTITGATTPATGKTGDTFYNTASNTYYIYSNGTWTPVGGLSANLVSGSFYVGNSLNVATATPQSSISLNGFGVTSDLAMSNKKITGLGSPITDTDAATKAYVDSKATPVVDNLLSTSSTSALSALQGNVLNTALSTKMNTTATFGGDVSGTFSNLQLGAGSIIASKLKTSGGGALSSGGGANNVLQSNGDGTFSWLNISTGVPVDPNSLSLPTGQLYLGNASGKATATPQSSISLNGFGVTSDLAMSNKKITGLGSPTDGTDAATKAYVDTKSGLTPRGLNFPTSPAPVAGDVFYNMTTNTYNVYSSGWNSLLSANLDKGSFFVGNASNVATATAKNAIPLSGFAAPTEAVSIGGQRLTTVAYPTDPNDAATKAYVDAHSGGGTGTDSQVLSIAGNFLSISNGNTVALPTSGGGSGTVTSVSGTAPIVSNGSATTPVISITQASASAAGSMSAADKAKLDAITGSNTGDQTLTSLLPTQTGNAGKVLQTDGSIATWQTASGGTWGSITGTLSNQTDLNAALNGKQASLGFTPENSANKVTSISGASTDAQYPSAKLVYDQLALKASSASAVPYSGASGNVDLGTHGLTTAALRITTGASNGYVLKSDATGNASWQAASSSYKGMWNANTNTPVLTDGVGTNGDYYVVSVAGTFNSRTFTQGGQAVYNGTTNIWEPISAVETDPIVKAITGIVKSDGTNITAAVAGDFPTLNQNTTGTASNVTGTVAIANGGTGATTAGAALTNLGAASSAHTHAFASLTAKPTTVLGYGITDAMSNPMTAAGDIVIGGASGAPTKLAATTNGFVLTLSGGLPTWAAANVSGVVVGANGGTGVANTGKTITLGGNFVTSGASSLTLTTTAATNVTLPTSGTLMTNPMSAVGDIIIGGASGAPTKLTSGTTDYVLTSNGVGVAPSWKVAPGGSMPTGTVGGNTLRYNGSAWVESTALTNDATNVATTGKLTVGGAFQTSGAVYANVRKMTTLPTGDSDWLASDYIVNIWLSGNRNIALPNPALNSGRVLIIRNNSIEAGLTGLYTYTPYAPINNTSIASSRGQMLVSDGTSWYCIAGF